MKTRYLADSLALPANWQAERYSTHVRLLRDKRSGESNEFTADVVIPYDFQLEPFKARCAEVVSANS